MGIAEGSLFTAKVLDKEAISYPFWLFGRFRNLFEFLFEVMS
jgi:hypothetical protein